MAETISVFGGNASAGGTASGGSGGGNHYLITLKCCHGGTDMRLVADCELDLDRVFPVFVRYKFNGRNGRRFRRRKSKWYAYRYTHRINGGNLYDTNSMLGMELFTGHEYTLYGRLPDGSATRIPEIIMRNFDGSRSMIHLLRRRSEMEDRKCLGFNNCGIALANKDGVILSNIARMKVVLFSESGLHIYPMYSK